MQNFKENILYREEDNKYIILFGEHHEINSTHKTLIIHKLIELVQKYELDLINNKVLLLDLIKKYKIKENNFNFNEYIDLLNIFNLD